jgi:hypothetical protein
MFETLEFYIHGNAKMCAKDIRYKIVDTIQLAPDRAQERHSAHVAGW